jgi:hypothetical protein
MDTRVPFIRADRVNTVQSLLQQPRRDDAGDDGFPIVEKEDGLIKVVGYIGDNELDHALCEILILLVA